MEMTKEQYEEFSKAISRNNNSVEYGNNSVKYDDDLFGELDLSSETEDDKYYTWSIYGQCWLPK